jgi:pre-mRNA-splicing factor CDC5/CEF1
MIEARNLRALSSTQTPLLGGENADLSQGTGFDGVTPRNSAIQTPNPMATPLRGSAMTETPGSQTPFKTPLRDNFKINDQGARVGETPREEKMLQTQRKRSLMQGISNLPKPRNEWEIRLPEMSQDEEEAPSKKNQVEDMSDVEREMKESVENNEKERFARRSLAVQLGLPRPASFNPKMLEEDGNEIDQMINEELGRILRYDSIKYPVTGSKVVPGAAKIADDIADLEDEFESKALEDARKELDSEIINNLGLDSTDNVKEAVWKHVSSKPDFEKRWNEEHDDLLFSAQFNTFMTLHEMKDDKDIIQGLDKTIQVKKKKKGFCFYTFQNSTMTFVGQSSSHDQRQPPCRQIGREVGCSIGWLHEQIKDFDSTDYGCL